ncbi:uncharacterized protein LOC123217975 isoform X1 [Mangifera indica]|uniref:uncharacterized protein LOC123217975 isoform X1 n=1 Tax=Mangifera indica TaxID=29780 RepID=UPI001CFA6B99|nr:uncharacterized protein LOC123217975 isoform X1 [Mangifera indica]XP_044495024.1 uncharacterized protein LOC123217975 isoform X1 [Mangifera indica]XP_044495025.1 uncharacterized protein LOC123217975 isoform X1 [Mangifera indica]
MEALYLLCSILSTFFTSLALSLLLSARTLFHRFYSPRASSSSSTAASDAVFLYEGTVWHERRCPVRHSFKYPVRYALFDLDHAFRAPSDHLSAGEARRVAETNGPVLLLTIPRSVGYEQNPLSLYYCYEVEGSTQCLKKCIAEVTNTPWGERVSFVFNPKSDLVAKPLHVSPFMDMLGNWNIRANSPGENLNVSISVQHPQLGDYFVATLRAKRVSSVTVSDHAMFFWLMPHKVALWIYWHAFKLWWKNVSFIQHPRYTNPEYRKEALIRDQKLQCCPAVRGNNDNYLQVEGSDLRYQANWNIRDRWFVWRDAKWPWS